MRILLVHQNFPGQFKHLAPALAADPANEVVVFTMNEYAGAPGIKVVRYRAARGTSKEIHAWVGDLESKVIRGEAAFRAARRLRDEAGFTPDVIVAHPGWGESLFLKDVWPSARLGIYCEFYYHAQGADIGFDPEFPSPEEAACRVRVKNMNYQAHFEQAQGGIAPTEWQRSVFPEPFRSRIAVVHDGIDTAVLRPKPDVQLRLNDKPLTRQDEIITFVNRNLEPCRGYHSFMRALPQILRARPNARVLIVGGDQVSYGPPPAGGGTWKETFLAEVKDRIDGERVHFIGKIPYPQFIALLQLSTVHVYLTYPFVLSWSLLEAMSCGCAIVASDTAPVREAILDGHTGRLVDFFAPDQLAGEVVRLLESPAERERLGQAARAHAQQHYDLQAVCLPRQVEWVHSLAAAGGQAEPGHQI